MSSNYHNCQSTSKILDYITTERMLVTIWNGKLQDSERLFTNIGHIFAVGLTISIAIGIQNQLYKSLLNAIFSWKAIQPDGKQFLYTTTETTVTLANAEPYQ
jgi:hypothetical protein